MYAAEFDRRDDEEDVDDLIVEVSDADPNQHDEDDPYEDGDDALDQTPSPP